MPKSTLTGEKTVPILDFPMAKQETANSCWACAARCILNFAAGKTLYASDQALADAYAKAANNSAYKDINEMRSAADALHFLGMPGNLDGSPFPTIAELVDEIDKKKPVMPIVGETDPKGKRQPNYQKGHWMVVIGVTDEKEIVVFDPNDGKAHTVPYNAATYTSGVYWESSTYF